ncbi:hypothetical protein ABPG75_000113 [Micractinium tetrahymenae]
MTSDPKLPDDVFLRLIVPVGGADGGAAHWEVRYKSMIYLVDGDAVPDVKAQGFFTASLLINGRPAEEFPSCKIRRTLRGEQHLTCFGTEHFPLCVNYAYLQVGCSKLVPAQPGEVHFTLLQQATEDEELLSAPYRLAVEAAAREVAAAAAQEVRHTGFGKHTLEWGWNVVVLPSNDHICEVHRLGGVILLSTGKVQACMRHSSNPAAALMFSIAHEMGHHVARHLGELVLAWKAAQYSCRGSLQEASKAKFRSWQKELEADEFAAAVLMRAQVPSSALGEGLMASVRCQAEATPAELSDLQKNAAYHDNHAIHTAGGCTEMQRAQQAVTFGSPDQLGSLRGRWLAMLLARIAAAKSAADAAKEEAESSGAPPAPSKVAVGSFELPAKLVAALPEHEAVALLRALLDTHPPLMARVARLRQLAGRTDMLLRATAPAAAAGGSPGMTPAERVADLLAAAAAEQRVSAKSFGTAAAAAGGVVSAAVRALTGRAQPARNTGC